METVLLYIVGILVVVVGLIVSIALLDFIWTMQVFPLVWMTTGGGPIHATEMMSIYTYKAAFSRFQCSIAAASAPKPL